MGWWDDFDAQSSGLSPAEQTYANQTAAREAYYARFPDQDPTKTFTQDQREGLAGLVDRDQAASTSGPVDARPEGYTGVVMSEGDFQAWLGTHAAGGKLTVQQLAALENEIKARGWSVKRNAEGRATKVVGPDGSIFDPIEDDDEGGKNRFVWQRATGPGGAALPGQAGDTGAAGAGVAGIEPGSLLKPFQESFARPTFTPPPDFVAPTGDEVFQDQGFQFRMDQGRQALERSAAARGTLLTTGTLKDLDSFSQGLASQEYGNVYGRRAGEYESKYGKQVEGFERDYNQALGEYGIRKGNFYEGQDRPFNKLTTLAGFGTLPPENYSGQYGNLMMYGANNAGNYLTQGANARAAGQVGASNAWQQAAGSLANLGGQYASIYNQPWQSRAPYGQGYGVYR